MIIIDYKDPRPIYEQIVNRFKKLILNDVLKTDEKMPSVRALAMELSINPNTIQKAYSELERQGYIYTVKGRGNFVSDSSALKDGYRDEIMRQLDELCERADGAGISAKELADHLTRHNG